VLARTVLLLGMPCKSCEIAPTVFMVWPPSFTRGQGPQRFGQKLDSEDGKERSGERLAGRHTEDPLARGEDLGLSTELSD
jgi:hypothetical protein